MNEVMKDEKKKPSRHVRAKKVLYQHGISQI